MNLESRFGEVAGAYHAFRPAYPRAVFDRVMDALPPPHARALDIGSGTGLAALPWCERFREVVATDADARMLATFPARPHNLVQRHARAEELDFPEHSFDLVSAANSFHWMDGPLVAAKAIGWLRDGGLFAVIRYSPPHTRDASERVLADEMQHRWKPFLNVRLEDEAYSVRSVRRVKDWSEVDVVTIDNVVELSAEELAGFCRSTSYGAAFAATLPYPDRYFEDLVRKLDLASGGAKIPVDFGIELVLARR